MKPEDRKILNEMKAMGTLTQFQAQEYHRLLTIEEAEVIEITPEPSMEVIEEKPKKSKKK